VWQNRETNDSIICSGICPRRAQKSSFEATNKHPNEALETRFQPRISKTAKQLGQRGDNDADERYALNKET
jgi:hypothetical protein